jgi:azobenzene reductase
MKNFLDHFWEEFAGKVFGYICTSHEKGLTVMSCCLQYLLSIT